MKRILAAADYYFLRHLPPRVASRARTWALRRLGAQVGSNVKIGPGVRVVGAEGLILRDGVTVARDVTLDARGGLELLPNALIGFETIILTSTHNSGILGAPIQEQGMFVAPSQIGERAWLGTRVIVLPGVMVGDDSIVGSGSVVTKSVEAESVVAGVPARRIRRRG